MRRTTQNPSALVFAPGDSAGWTTAGIAGFNHLKPTAAIRELIQNSLDAAIAAERSAIVRFCLEAACPTSKVPYIDTYQQAFEEAVAAYADRLSDNARAIIGEIADCLTNETCPVLFVTDNGIGLDGESMNRLLSDGDSTKQSDAAGSYGIGHSVVFPSSDLRYVLYGGLSKGAKIASGHAILASRPGLNGKERLSKDGIICTGITDDFFNRYDFPQGKEIPVLLAEKLEQIAAEWSSGSVVAVAGFNNFKEEYKDGHNLEGQVFRAAACNFFEAIHAGNLVVEVVSANGRKLELNKKNLPQVLSRYKDEKRRRRNDHFISGSKANSAFITLESEQPIDLKKVEVLEGIDLRVRVPCAGNTSLGMCRNGMWITDDIPMLNSSKFAERLRFNCLLRLRQGSEFSRLARKLEPPLHDALDMSRASKEDKATWRNVMDAVTAIINEAVPEQTGAAFRPDNIFTVQTGGISQGGRKPARTGSPTVVSRRRGDTAESEGEGQEPIPQTSGSGDGASAHKPDSSRKPFSRSGNLLNFGAVIKIEELRKCQVFFTPGTRTAGSEIRFALDESIDATSDAVSAEDYVCLQAESLRLDGSPIPKEQLAKDKHGNVRGILLGSLESGQEYQLGMAYSTHHLGVPDGQPVVLKVEVLRRNPEPTQAEA